MQTLPSSAFTTAAGAPSNLLLFICPGSKVLIEQPGLFQPGHGGFGAPWGSAEPERPRALRGDAAAAPRPDPGQEARDAITVPGLFIALGPVRWKMLPRPLGRICSLRGARKPTPTHCPAPLSCHFFLSVPKLWDPSAPAAGLPGTPSPLQLRALQGAGTPRSCGPFLQHFGGSPFPPVLPIPG